MKEKFKLACAILIMVLVTLFNPLQLSNSYNDNIAQAATIKLNKTSVTLIKGQTYQLKISGTNKKVNWSSANKKICIVNSKGKITSKAKGTTYIYAKVSKKTFKCKVVIVTPAISKKTLTLQSGSTYQLKISGTSAKVKWTTSNKNICTVSSTGKIQANYSGSATITATVLGKKYYCKVTVPKYFKASKTTISIKKGQSINLKIYTNISNSTNRYIINDTTVVSCEWGDWNINSKPINCPIKITGLKLGTTTVTFTNNKTSTKIVVKITVHDDDVKSNIIRLKNYIKEHGVTTSSNKKAISRISYYPEDEEQAAAIMYDELTDTLNFIYTSTFYTEKSTVELDISSNDDIQLIKPTITKLYTHNKTFFTGELEHYPYEFKYDDGIYSELNFNINNFTSYDYEYVNSVANVIYTKALKLWTSLLVNELLMSLDDIGFVNVTNI